MRVLELWRYPVKSIGGERLTEAQVTDTGIEHDRGWGLVDELTGNVLTARREPQLLMASAHMEGAQPVITTAAGEVLDGDTALSEWLDRPVTLTAAAGRDGGTYENPLDAEGESDWVSWQGPPDAWHDSSRTRLSIVSTATLAGWDSRRFRANVLVDGADEDDLVGQTVTIGGCGLYVGKRIDRCVMVTRPQPELPRDLDVLREIARDRDGCLAIGATVATPGKISVGDELVR